MDSLSGATHQNDWSRQLGLKAIRNCLLAIPVFFGTLIFLPTENRALAFFSASAAGAFGLLVASRSLARHASVPGISKYILFGYLLRILIGVVHNYAYFDDQYFASETTVYKYIWDYEWLDRSMVEVTQHWQAYGFTTLPPTKYFAENKNALLNLYNSLLYYFAGSGRHLNFCVWNSFHAGLTAILIGILCRLNGGNESSTKFCILLMICHPYLIFTNILERDGVGQFFIILGVTLFHVNRSSPLSLIAVTPIVAVLFHSMRQPYLAIALAGALAYVATEKGRLSGSRVILGSLAAACLLALGIGHFLGDAGFSRHANDLGAVFSPLRYPLRLIRAISGPFPWTQMWEKEIPGHEIHPMEYLTHVFNAVVLFYVIPQFVREVRCGIVDPLVSIGLLFFLSGLIAPVIHTPYVSVGIPLLLPFAVIRTHFRQYLFRSLIVTFVIFVILNLIYVSLGLKGSGLLRNMIYN